MPNNPKKLTLLSVQKKPSYEERDILNAARKAGLTTERIRITKPIADIDTFIASFGEIVIRRSILLDKVHKSTFIRRIKESGRVIINGTQDEYPFLSDKSYQQAVIRDHLPKLSIPTFEAKDRKILEKLIEKKILIFPFVAKKRVSALGKGVQFIEKESDLKKIPDIEKAIFQKVIKNTGEYRAYLVGQRVVGILKKQARKGTFLNNMTQNAETFSVSDPKTKKEIYKIAERIAKHFKVDILAVDILEGADGKKYFLETNTVPGWRFQKVLNLDETLGKKTVDLALALYRRNKDTDLVTHGPTYVRNYYDSHIGDLHRFSFHYLSRMCLWTKNNWYKKQLTSLKEECVGKNSEDTIAKLAYTPPSVRMTSPRKQRRKKYETQYALAEKNYALYDKYLFAQSLYSKDISQEVLTVLGEKDLKKTYKNLYKDKKALIDLSTQAVNFLYLTRDLMSRAQKGDLSLDPHYFIDVVKTTHPNDTSSLTLSLKLYLLTHTVIGESLFYRRLVTDKRYLKVIKEAERIVTNHYFDIPLDNKIELLVCARLCNTSSPLEPLILGEAARSFSPHGNFLIEPRGFKRLNMFSTSEHRNVLYIMATTPFKNPQ